MAVVKRFPGIGMMGVPDFRVFFHDRFAIRERLKIPPGPASLKEAWGDLKTILRLMILFYSGFLRRAPVHAEFAHAEISGRRRPMANGEGAGDTVRQITLPEKNQIYSPRKPGTSNCPGFSRRTSLRPRRSPGLPRPDHKHTHKYCRCTFSFPFSFRFNRYSDKLSLIPFHIGWWRRVSRVRLKEDMWFISSLMI